MEIYVGMGYADRHSSPPDSSDYGLHREGVTPAAAQRGIETIAQALGRQGPMTRVQIRSLLERAGVPVAGQALIHILFRASIDGLIVRGPMAGSDHAFVLAADWLGQRPRLDRARALAELTRRYLVAHGPAGERDLAKWAQLPLRDVRAGLQRIAPSLVARGDGLVDLRRGPAPRLPPPRLLGLFDPVLLGWRSRAFLLGDAENVVTRNGIIRAIVLIKGRASGTWTMPKGRVRMELWDEQSKATLAALEREASRVERYLSSEP